MLNARSSASRELLELLKETGRGIAVKELCENGFAGIIIFDAEGEGPKTIEVVAVGIVVRVDQPQEGEHGFAVKFERMPDL